MGSVKLDGKTVIVTGSNTGIGRATVLHLAKRGARVIMACRNEARTEPVRQQLIQETGSDQIIFMKLDLSSLESVRNFAKEFNENESRLDILVNNAGMANFEKVTTDDSFDLMFQTNHLGHFLLTNLLMEKLKSSAPSRIVNVSSSAHEKNPANLDDLNFETKKYEGIPHYGSTKSANILFTVQLSKLLEGSGVTAYALHPGLVNTELSREMPCYSCCCFMCLLCCIGCCIFRTKLKNPDEGAQTTLYCCLEPSIGDHSGRYYSDCREVAAKSHATDPERAQKLWDMSKEMCHI